MTMAKSKTSKKKYIPKPIYYPNLIIAIHAFKPIEDAITQIIETSEIDQDQFGNYLYINGDNKPESFIDGLEIYISVITNICIINKITFDMTPLFDLRQTMLDHDDFSEFMLVKAKKCLSQCKVFIAKTPSNVTRYIALQLAEARKQNHEFPIILKHDTLVNK